MNPLQEKPGLFANSGEFQIKYNTEDGEYIEPFDIDIWYSHQHVLDNCQLIARPIADMTVKEVSQINEDQYYGTTYQEVIKNLETVNINMRTDHALQVLDFGVYFGPQSHFEDGTVLDSTETEPGRN